MALGYLKLRPLSPWRTPWQADTLTGMLMTVCARVHGADVLRSRIIEPMLAGEPPFVLSDAFPQDLLPVPIWLRVARWPDDADRKRIKRAQWVGLREFQRARRGEVPAADTLISERDVVYESTRQHNTLDRISNTTGEAESGLGIYSRPETLLRTGRSGDYGGDYLSVYFRILDPDAAHLLVDLFHDLALTGFGADTATGRGRFEIIGEPDSVSDLDNIAGEPNAVVTLSTFQPGRRDPPEGLWDAFPKFGKLGPDFGLPNSNVHKKTLILFRPGACFRTSANAHVPFLGRAVPMHELLPPDAAHALAGRSVNVVHPAFTLAVPAQLNPELFS